MWVYMALASSHWICAISQLIIEHFCSYSFHLLKAFICYNKLFTHAFLPNCFLLIRSLLQQSRQTPKCSCLGRQCKPHAHVCRWDARLVIDKKISLHHIKEHKFLWLLSVLKWKDKSMRGAQALPGKVKLPGHMLLQSQPQTCCFPSFFWNHR